MIGQPRIEGAGAVPTHTSGPLGSVRAVGLLSGGGGGEAVTEILGIWPSVGGLLTARLP